MKEDIIEVEAEYTPIGTFQYDEVRKDYPFNKITAVRNAETNQIHTIPAGSFEDGIQDFNDFEIKLEVYEAPALDGVYYFYQMFDEGGNCFRFDDYSPFKRCKDCKELKVEREYKRHGNTLRRSCNECLVS